MRIAALAVSLWLVVTGIVVPVDAALINPYEILERHYAATRNPEDKRGPRNLYTVGRSEIVGSGVTGLFRMWSAPGERFRMEVEDGLMKAVEGDNGSFKWEVDHNGKVRILGDSLSARARLADSLMGEFAYVDSTDGRFDLRYDGLDTVNGNTCYVVTITSIYHTDTSRWYIDTTTFYQNRSVTIRPSRVTQLTLSDFREVDGVTMAFFLQEIDLSTGTVRETLLDSVVMGQTFDSSLFEPPEEDAADIYFADSGCAKDIPFRLVDNQILVKVTIRGQEQLWQLDSGADQTIMDKGLAEQLELPLSGTLTCLGATGATEMAVATSPPLSVGDVVFVDEQLIAVADIAWMAWDEDSGVTGILGYDFLSRVITRIDYARELLSFFDPTGFTYNGPGVILDAPLSPDGDFEVPLVIDDSLRGVYDLDLGATNMFFNYPYAQVHELAERPGFEVLVVSLDGYSIAKMVKVSSVEVAGMTVKNLAFAVPVDPSSGTSANTRLAGTAGNSLLRHFVLYLDYEHGRLIFEKGRDFGKEF